MMMMTHGAVIARTSISHRSLADEPVRRNFAAHRGGDTLAIDRRTSTAEFIALSIQLCRANSTTRRFNHHCAVNGEIFEVQSLGQSSRGKLEKYYYLGNMGVNATGTLGKGRRLSAEDARIEAP